MKFLYIRTTFAMGNVETPLNKLLKKGITLHLSSRHHFLSHAVSLTGVYTPLRGDELYCVVESFCQWFETLTRKLRIRRACAKMPLAQCNVVVGPMPEQASSVCVFDPCRSPLLFLSVYNCKRAFVPYAPGIDSFSRLIYGSDTYQSLIDENARNGDFSIDRASR